jgi:hypothetical protein
MVIGNQPISAFWEPLCANKRRSITPKKLLLELAKNSLTYKVIPPSTTNCAPVAKPDSFEAK